MNPQIVAIHVAAKTCVSIFSDSLTLSHTAHTGVDSFLDCAFRAGSSSVFLNSLLGKHLIDCIALASFTLSLTQVPGTVHYFWPKNGHSEKVPDSFMARTFERGCPHM